MRYKNWKTDIIEKQTIRKSTDEVLKDLSSIIYEYHTYMDSISFDQFKNNNIFIRASKDFIRDLFETSRQLDITFKSNCKYIDWNNLEKIRNDCIHHPDKIENKTIYNELYNAVRNLENEIKCYEILGGYDEMASNIEVKNNNPKFVNSTENKLDITINILKLTQYYLKNTGNMNVEQFCNNKILIRASKDLVNEIYQNIKSLDYPSNDFNYLRKYRNKIVHQPNKSYKPDTFFFIMKDQVKLVNQKLTKMLVQDYKFTLEDFDKNDLSTEFIPEINIELAKYENDIEDSFIEHQY